MNTTPFTLRNYFLQEAFKLGKVILSECCTVSMGGLIISGGLRSTTMVGVVVSMGFWYWLFDHVNSCAVRSMGLGLINSPHRLSRN